MVLGFCPAWRGVEATVKNVKAQIVGNILTITVDMSQDVGTSKSGKSTNIATTEGNVRLPNGAYIGLNVYRPVPVAGF